MSSKKIPVPAKQKPTPPAAWGDFDSLVSQAVAPGYDPYLKLLDTISAAMAPLHTLHQQAVEALASTVQEIVRNGSRNAQLIERTLDQLLSHACMPTGLALFKALCRHYWPLDPQATASYINAYREMWDCDDKSETEEVEP
jgi:hypothetical protein